MKVALVVCALTATALAGPAEQRKKAEALEQEAHASGDPEKYVTAGKAYLDLYSQDPATPDGDEILYNAGASLERGHATAAAIQAFDLIVQRYPNGTIAVKALAREGRMYGDIAMYDRAAEKLEKYATKYAGEKDAPDALSDALYYRKAIGDRDKAVADTNLFVKTYGAKKPHEAADAMWSLVSLYESDPETTIKSLRMYVAQWGEKGGAERVVIAHAKIGELLWKKSCRGATVDGLCVTENNHTKRTCGDGTTDTLTPKKRDERTVKDALAELELAAEAFEKVRTDDATARYYYAQGKLIAADLELETTYLGLAFPQHLDFSATNRKTREASMKRFSQWIDDKQKAGRKVTAAYDAVFAIKDAASSITAAERMGVLTLTFSSVLVTADIPPDVRRIGKDGIQAYCQAMNDAAAPLEERAAMSFAVCLSKSTELGWWGDSSRQCELQLTRMRPADFPLMHELPSDAVQVAPVIASEPPL